MKIIISGPATASEIDSDQPVLDPKRLAQLNGLQYSDDLCSNYFAEELDDIGLIGGAIRLAFEAPAGPLKVITEYHSPRPLNPHELKQLARETEGQWSDGIGESDFDHRDRLGLDVSIWSHRGKIEVEQIDDGITIAAPKKNPIFNAVQERSLEQATQAIAAGANINDRNKYSLTPLLSACQSGSCDIALLLINHGADISANCNEDRTPLAYLAMANVSSDQSAALIAVAAALLQRGANVDASDADGMTPLMWAANRGKDFLITFLLDNNARINAADHQGCTALMYTQNLATAKMLLDHGADPTLRNKANQNAADHALQNKHWKQSTQLAALYQAAK